MGGSARVIVCGHLCLLTGTYQRLAPATHRAWETEALSSLMIRAPGPFRETFQGCKTSKSLGEDLHFKEAEEEFAAANFLK